jgi:hypothetical protein
VVSAKNIVEQGILRTEGMKWREEPWNWDVDSTFNIYLHLIPGLRIVSYERFRNSVCISTACP